MLIFGGSNYGIGFGSDYQWIRLSTQISEVVNCGTKKIGNLPFDFKNGACANMYQEEFGEFVLLCFAMRPDLPLNPRPDRNTCYRLVFYFQNNLITSKSLITVDLP